MFSNIFTVLSLLTRSEQIKFGVLVLLFIVTGLIEAVGVASVFPFLMIMADPEAIRTNPMLAMMHEAMGFDSDRAFLVAFGLLSFVLVMVGMVVKMASTYAIHRFGAMREYHLSARLLGAYLMQPYAWFLERHTSDVVKSVLNEVTMIVVNTLLPLLQLLSRLFITAFIILLLILVNPWVTLAAGVLIGGIYISVTRRFRKQVSQYGTQRFEANEQRYKLATEIIGGIKDVKLMALESAYLERYRIPAHRYAEAQAFSAIIGHLPRYVLEAVTFAGLLLAVLGFLIVSEQGVMAILPTIGVFAFAAARLLPAGQVIYQELSRMRFNAVTFKRLAQDFKEATGRQPQRLPPPPPLGLTQAIVFRGVRFRYPRAGRAALDGLDLEIRAGMTVGIVGGTGAGKTTVIDLLLGLQRPQDGSIEIDGRVLDDALLPAWQQSIGYVPQQIFLFDDTITANIAFGVAPDAVDHAAVERAARTAELHDFITGELPQGYGTFVGERGVRLSGGQRQRIGIARALYRNPDVLVLDEATSALDNITEGLLMRAVHNMAGTRTIVMIAHRLSTVQDCDKIIMLENGRVIDEGPYDVLIERSPAFRAMALVSNAAQETPETVTPNDGG